MIELKTIWSAKWGAWERLVGVMETLGSPSCRGWCQCQKWDPVTDVIKYLKLLIVQLESVPVLQRYSYSKEALWTRAVNFLLPSSHLHTQILDHARIKLSSARLQYNYKWKFRFSSMMFLISLRHNRHWVINVQPDGRWSSVCIALQICLLWILLINHNV